MFKEKIKIFLNGLITGLLLQLAVGPVFFFIVNLTLQKTLLHGLAGVVAVTLVDYFYISLSIIGLASILGKVKNKKYLDFPGAVILIVLGIIIFEDLLNGPGQSALAVGSLAVLDSFVAVLILTAFNPMTILFYTGLFAAKAGEFKYSKRDLIIFGLATGLATFIFMGTAVLILSALRENIPPMVINIANSIAGLLLILYGLKRIFGKQKQK